MLLARPRVGIGKLASLRTVDIGRGLDSGRRLRARAAAFDRRQRWQVNATAAKGMPGGPEDETLATLKALHTVQMEASALGKLALCEAGGFPGLLHIPASDGESCVHPHWPKTP